MTTIQALTNKLWEQKKSCLFFQHFPTKRNIAILKVVSRTLRVRDSRIYIAIPRVVSRTLRVRDSRIYYVSAHEPPVMRNSSTCAHVS